MTSHDFCCLTLSFGHGILVADQEWVSEYHLCVQSKLRMKRRKKNSILCKSVHSYIIQSSQTDLNMLITSWDCSQYSPANWISLSAFCVVSFLLSLKFCLKPKFATMPMKTKVWHAWYIYVCVIYRNIYFCGRREQNLSKKQSWGEYWSKNECFKYKLNH